MSTRYNSNSKVNYGQTPLSTGYEKKGGYGEPDISIPSCGIEDVDTSMFRLFDNEIVPECGGIDGAPLRKVPVIFAAGEKWALLKRGRPLRDRNNTLLLPLITIMRTEMNQTVADDVAGRGINQQVGEFVVRRRLDKSDRDYQSLINRLFLKNQKNLAVGPNDLAVPGQLTSDRKLGDLSDSQTAQLGAFLEQNRLNNVYETIVVPLPQFYTVKYQVTVWTQYTQHANQIIEKIFSSFLPQAQSWRLDTEKGYWFVAKLEDGSLVTETNFDDMSAQERFIKHSFNVAVPAYFFASSAPGAPIPLKRYVSCPIISFEAQTNDSVELGSSTEESSYVIGSDDPTLPLDEQKNNRTDQRSIGWRLQKTYQPDDPAMSMLPRGYTAKIVNKTPKGETVYSATTLGGLEIFAKK